MSEGSWVGLDVHARSVVAGVIDQGSGELRSVRVAPGKEGTVGWLKTLPAPVRVVYEAVAVSQAITFHREMAPAPAAIYEAVFLAGATHPAALETLARRLYTEP